ncbi:MAG: hypothetical protein F9K40_06275 [Kofleriaceae bacterium]|nr:MAG: hypothetical protein F9K40_06275 [Kofleriaceae bacterium]MBZ0238407.1 hypothetical protein [Kofleriaceae bacterium]
MNRLAAALTAAVLLLSSASAAHADAPGETPTRSRTPKRLSTAVLVTLAATSGPLAVAALGESCKSDACAGTTGMIGLAGLVLGPSTGHWYAGEGVTTGLVLRGAATTATVFLALRDPHLESPVVTIGGLILAAGVMETGILWDLFTLPRAVRRHNRDLDLLLTPVVTDRAAGLALAGAW